MSPCCLQANDTVSDIWGRAGVEDREGGDMNGAGGDRQSDKDKGSDVGGWEEGSVGKGEVGS